MDGVRVEGKWLGNWLDKTQAQALLDAPDATTVKGLRDRAILVVLLGCGLRREEAARVSVQHIQQREGRWAIVDPVGKRNKTRSVPMPSWAKAALDAWCNANDISDDAVFRAIRRGDHVQAHRMIAQAVREAWVRCLVCWRRRAGPAPDCANI